MQHLLLLMFFLLMAVGPSPLVIRQKAATEQRIQRRQDTIDRNERLR